MDEKECCPKFDPKNWEEKTHIWKNKKFVKDKVFTLFYMPINFGSVITKLFQKTQNANATVPDWLCLSDHTSMFNMDIYLAVDKEVENANNVLMDGKFFSKVYEGPFSDTKKWCTDFQAHTKSKNMSVKKMFMWYTTCPKCAKKYGKNYVVVIAKIE
jgi:hypothetical protein